MNERLNPLYTPCPYAVGDILTTRNAANPSTRWPGTTWKAIETMLLGASSKHPVGSTGGAESVTSGKHALSYAEMPAWLVTMTSTPAGLTTSNAGYQVSDTKSGWVAMTLGEALKRSSQGVRVEGNPITAVGQPHTHTVATMPPYTAVYIWERTA